tara:strand:- start:4171 stop:5874 length:1704 start_codon:yes stop_codon:yes gene_type:complete
MNQAEIQMMDITCLKAVIGNLRKILLPSRFELAQQPDSQTLQIGLRTLKGLNWLELSWDAQAPRIVEIKRPPKIGSQSTLAKQIQYGLNQLAINEIKQRGFERVVEFCFSFRPGEEIQKILIIELMGRHSNLFLINNKNKVITIGRQIRSHQSRFRPISTGDFYVEPPPLKGIKPSSNEVFFDWKERLSLIPITIKKALQDNYQGISPALALQLADDKEKEAERILSINVHDLQENDWERIHKRWLIWLTSLEEENLYIFFEGPTHFRCWHAKTNSLNSTQNNFLELGFYYKRKLEERKIKQTKENIEKKLLKMKKNENSLLNKQRDLFLKIKDHNKIKIQADCLLSLRSPNKEQIEEAQKLYKVAKKLKRSEKNLIERIDYHSKRIKSLEESETFLEGLLSDKFEEPYEILNRLYELLTEIDEFLDPSNKNTQNNKSKKNQALKPLELKSPSGMIIQVGRNHRQNELISLKKARKGDFWFHVQECPGSHVVLKSSNGLIEEDDIQLAADIAAFFSRAKENKVVPIVKVPTEKLKRIQGALPGTVSYEKSEVLWGVPHRAIQHIQQK